MPDTSMVLKYYHIDHVINFPNKHTTNSVIDEDYNSSDALEWHYR